MRFGLINITERIELIKGTIELKSEKNKGTSYTIKIPINVKT